MPYPIPTGLHAPITNIRLSEATTDVPIVSPGSIGQEGNEQTIEQDAVIENLPRVIQEMLLQNEPDFTLPDMSSLADIGVASFKQKPIIETVFGPDDRIQVKDTKKYPWRASASLLITAADDSQWIGTAWFVNPRTLITAGHCVFINHSDTPGRNGFVKKIQVMPGRDGATIPYGVLTATEFWTVKGWGESGLENYDYGAIILPAPFPQDIGYFGYKVIDDDSLKKCTANVAGYPGDKLSGTAWYDNRIIASLNNDKVFYAADTAGGQSGAVVYIIENGVRWAVAIHAYGGTTTNSGTRISSLVAANLENWKSI